MTVFGTKTKLTMMTTILGLLMASVAPLALASSDGPGITPDAAIEQLKEGNQCYHTGEPNHPRADAQRMEETAEHGQNPFATVIACSDSRVPVERVFDQGIGDIFTIRVAGNVYDTDEIGSIEYGVDHLGTPVMVVLGHGGCGAVTAVVTGAELHGSIPPLVGIEDKVAGEKLLEEYAAIIAEFTTDIDEILTLDLNDAETGTLNKIKEFTGKYDESFSEITAKYHEIEEFKETLDELGEKLETQLATLLHEHEKDLEELEASGASPAEIAMQTELLVVRLSHDEVEFLLDKQVDGIAAMEKELGELHAYLTAIEHFIPKVAKGKHEEEANLEMLAEVEKELEEYTTELSKIIKDELIVGGDLVSCNEDIKGIESWAAAIAAGAEEQVQHAQAAANQATIVLLRIGTVLGGVLAFFTSRSITQPLNKTVTAMEAVAAGDYSQRLDATRKDELGKVAEGLNAAAEATGKAMQDVKDAAEREQAKKPEEDRQRAEAQRKEAEDNDRKVKHILEVAELVAERDYSKQVEVTGDDALGQLRIGQEITVACWGMAR